MKYTVYVWGPKGEECFTNVTYVSYNESGVLTFKSGDLMGETNWRWFFEEVKEDSPNA